jgi:hypothetical protein
VRKNIKAFVHWTRDELRLGRDPSISPFPVDQVSDRIRRYKTHEKYQNDSKTLAEAAKPEKFKESIKWEDWKPTFLNFICAIPGRDGVPLKYVCRDKDEADPVFNEDFIDDYVAMAPLTGDSYAIDTVQVHTFLVNFVSGNNTAGAKIQGLQRPNDGREAFKRLVEHYEGVGIHAIDIREADEVIKNLFYAGEKPPHMWWLEFEKKLTRAFNAYVKREGRIVHSDSMKIWMLVDKIKADFLTPTKAQLEIELSRTPMTITYEQALSLFRNMVNQKHPRQMGAAQHRVRRNVNEVSSGRGGRGGRGGHGRGGCGGRHGGRGGRGTPHQTRTDSRFITLTDGQQIEYHPSFKFSRDVFLKMKQEDKDTLRRERQQYNERRRNRSEIQELRSQVQELGGTVSTESPPTDSVSVSQRLLVSQITSTDNSIMGGRNEQAQYRQSRRIAAVVSKRQVQAFMQLPKWEDPPVNTMAENECDTNADTCCLGKNFIVLSPTSRTADVYAYDTSIKPIENVPIISGATAYDDPITGNTYILVFNESLYYGQKLDHTLNNPNQLRAYGLPLWDNPYDHMHAMSIEVNGTLRIPLRARGTKIGFCTRVPTRDEPVTCEHIQMTIAHPWNPSEVQLSQVTAQGGSPPSWKRRIESLETCPCSMLGEQSEYVDPTSDEALLSVEPSLVLFGERLRKRYRMSQVQSTEYDQHDTPARRTFVSDERHVKVSAELMAERFGIGPIRAQRTLRVTTQRGVRSAILPIARRCRADRVFAVKRLKGKFATDTAYGKLRSLRSNIGCQLYSHKCGFKVAYPIQKVDGDHVGDTLTQFISDFGVPEHLTFDGASVQTGPKTRFMSAIRKYEIK